MVTIFLDECGYTGQDLLNLDQPVFALASLCCEEDACKEMKNSFFSRVRAAELKHVSLAKRHSQQRMVLDFLNHLSTQPGLVKLLVAHKKYTLTTMVVNLLIEPAANRDGMDLFKNGANTIIADWYFSIIPVLGGQPFFDELLNNFQNMMLQRTPETFNRFFDLVVTQGPSDRLNKLLWNLRMAYYKFGYKVFDSSSHCLDIAVACTLALMIKWREDIGQGKDITLIHDDSSAMSRSQYFWNMLVSPDIPEVQFVFDQDRKWAFPVGVQETCPEDSGNWVGLQLVDVLAGATTRHAKWVLEGKKADDDYAVKLDSVLPQLLTPAYTIWPSEPIPPEAVDSLETKPLPTYFLIG